MRLALALLLSSPMFAQPVTIGLRTGLLPTPLLTGASASPLTLGPCIEFHLWRGASIGVDLLFRHAEAHPATVWAWEAPATFIYRRQRLFLRAGISVNRIFDIAGAAPCARGPFGEQFYCVGNTAILELRHRSVSGIVLGGGLRLKWKKVWLDPELRLTHWTDRNFGVRDSAVRSNLNQLGFFVGVGF